MAHEVIEIKDEQGKPQKEKTKLVEKIHTSIKTVLPPFIDSLVMLTIAFWYFFFTGLAILFGKTLPKGWVGIATSLTKGKIAKKIKDMAEAVEEKKATTYKIVDLESKREIPNAPIA